MGILDSISKNVTEALKKAEQERQTAGVDDIAQLSREERDRAFKEAATRLKERFTPEIEAILNDVLLPEEEVIYKVRSSPSGDRSQLVLTDRNVIIVSKGLFGGQGQDTTGGLLGLVMGRARISVRVYPLSEILSIEVQPLKGITVGHFQVLTRVTLENDNESKFLFDTHIGYFQAIHVYRKIRELQSGNRLP